MILTHTVVNIRWEGYEQPCHRPLVYAKNEVNVALTGLGTLEGQGKEVVDGLPREDAFRRAPLCGLL